jgi:hypothetical protein
MLATRLEDHDRAAQLLGTGERLREQIGSPQPRPEQQALDSCVDVLRTALGRDALEQAIDAGRALPLDETLTTTLQWLHSDRAAGAKSPTVLMPDTATPR